MTGATRPAASTPTVDPFLLSQLLAPPPPPEVPQSVTGGYMPGMGTLPGPTDIPSPPPDVAVAPTLGNSGSVPTYAPGRGGDAGNSAAPAAIASGAADPATSMDAARAAAAAAAANRMESQGGAPMSLPTAFSPTHRAILAAQGQYAAGGFGRGPMAGAGLSSAPGIGSQLAALGGAPGAVPQSLSGLAVGARPAAAPQVSPQQAAALAAMARRPPVKP